MWQTGHYRNAQADLMSISDIIDSNPTVYYHKGSTFAITDCLLIYRATQCYYSLIMYSTIGSLTTMACSTIAERVSSVKFN